MKYLLCVCWGRTQVLRGSPPLLVLLLSVYPLSFDVEIPVEDFFSNCIYPYISAHVFRHSEFLFSLMSRPVVICLLSIPQLESCISVPHFLSRGITATFFIPQRRAEPSTDLVSLC